MFIYVSRILSEQEKSIPMARQYDTKSARGQMMLNEKISTLIPKMALPTIVAQLITVIYNLVDTYFVSALGTNATAAIGVNSSLESVINMAATLLAVGTGSYISRLLGAKKEEKAKQLLSTVIFTGIIFSVIVMVIGYSFMSPLITLLGATPECKQYSIDYANYVLIAAPFMVITFILNSTLRSEGSATFSMIGTGFGGILNCFLDPLFINNFGLGVAGASMATAISKFVSCMILIYPYAFKKSLVSISVKSIKFIWDDIKEVMSISSSSFFRSALQVFSTTLLNRTAGVFGTAVLAAVSVGQRVMRFPFAIVMGFSQGYQPVVGFNWGAKRFDRVKKAFTFSAWVAAIGAAVMGLLLIFAAPLVISVFNKSSDPDVARYGAMFVRFESTTLPIHALVAVVNMYYAGIGRPVEALAISTARQGYCLIPCLLILPKIFNEVGLTACQGTADLLTVIIGVPLMIKAIKGMNIKIEEQKANPEAAV